MKKDIVYVRRKKGEKKNPTTENRRREMETIEIPSSSPVQITGSYSLPATPICNEDILFCIDVGPETAVEMKITGPNGRRHTRLDCIKQAILLFVHSKLTMNSDHRFGFLTFSNSTRLIRKDFSSDVDSVMTALRDISVDSSSSHADLTQLFRVATHEARKSRSQNRIFRVILLYCRSSMLPKFQLPPALKLFTFDVLYLHDKPGPDNCPQNVYDTLVDALEQVSEFEGYIFESGQGLTRPIFRHMCVLLSHPQQRCMQDEVDLPKSLEKKSIVEVPSSQGDDVIVISTSQ